MPAGYFAPATGLLWQIIEGYGKDPRALFDRCGIDADDIRDPDLRLPCVEVARLWARAADIIGDPCFGLRAARHLHPSHLGALGYAWLASRSLRCGFRRLARYLAMLTDERHVVVTDVADAVVVETRLEPDARAVPQRADIAMTVLMTMCRWNAGAGLTPLEVRFRHPVPGCAEAFEEVFRAPVVFGAERDELLLPAAEVDRPLPGDSPVLASLNDAYLTDYLARLARDDIVSRVKSAVGERLSDGTVRIADVADALNMSVRTLQRRLGTLDTSFRDVVDATRRELAECCLHDRRSSLTEVAFRAGFSSQSSFTNAMRRWTGMAPSAYRRRLWLATDAGAVAVTQAPA